MRDLQSSRLMTLKAVCFLLIGILASALLILQSASFRTSILLLTWSSGRSPGAYYFCLLRHRALHRSLVSLRRPFFGRALFSYPAAPLNPRFCGRFIQGRDLLGDLFPVPFRPRHCSPTPPDRSLRSP